MVTGFFFSVIVEDEEDFCDGPEESDYDSDDSNGKPLSSVCLSSLLFNFLDPIVLVLYGVCVFQHLSFPVLEIENQIGALFSFDSTISFLLIYFSL